ncbi:choice-of-anchor I family protein [Roseobacter weihaiensis]|uniref:choice-of-anchor I family protein n=1 Tax=Roseobacter weihaiensis TaxID=2763262 RepID=UPI001D0A699E|nr:choice-of-anchor I family protein [Roseobacter sp. H9]
MTFTLQILHASDLEGGLDAIENAPNFAAVVDALETDAQMIGASSILISAGDNYIPGPFFNAGGDFSLAATYEGFYNAYFGLIDETVLAPTTDTNGDGFFDNSEIEAQITAGLVTFDTVYTTDLNGDGFKDYFEEIDTSEGRVDIALMNAMGFDATAIGNHEFDAGTDAFENIVNYDSEEGNSLSSGRFGTPNFLQEVDTPGAQFPYLSANLDFSGDFDLGPLFTDEILPSSDFVSDLLSAREDPGDPTVTGADSNDSKLARATFIEVDGEQVGVIGATTQLLASISSPGTIDDVSNPGANDMAALAATLQPIIDDLIDGADDVAGTGDDINKVVLVSHLQQFALEEELAALLSGVDVIIAGGSDTRSADSQDRLRPGDTADQPYPAIVTGLDGNPTAIMSTDGEYSYVGRLVVGFDDSGVIVPTSVDETVSGTFATDEEGVLEVTGTESLEEAIAASDTATDVARLTDAVTGIVTRLDADIAGEVSVFLNGDRASVRTEETNFGNLTADANLAAAQAVDTEVLVSIKNGGGIRAAIGERVDNGDGTSTLLPTAANPVSGKEAGEVSELDIDNALRFDNGLVTVELTPEEVKIVLEHGVAATEKGATPGQFPQVGGIQFSFDPMGAAQILNDDGSVAVAGTRIQNVNLIDATGRPTQALIRDGEVVEAAPASLKVVTLDFLADGGDGYPFVNFSDVTDLGIGEQQALSDFLTEGFPKDGAETFDIADTDAAADQRIQNLSLRDDTVDFPVASEALLFAVAAEFEGSGASEVVAHEAGRLYVTNGEMGRIDVFDIATQTQVDAIDLQQVDGFDGLQSVAVKNGVVAVAISRAPVEQSVFGETVFLSQPGIVAFFDAGTGELQSMVDVGNLPDQLTFNDAGTRLLVAGEGEKNDDSDNDDNPLGTVAVIDVTDPVAPNADLLDFTSFNGLEDLARAAGIRIQDGVSFAEDLEPEYIAVSPDGTKAFVSLQENNALATIDLTTGDISDIFSLGTVDFSSDSALDPKDEGVIDIRSFDNLVGFRMADAIASFEIGEQTFIATANEGDSRGFDEDQVEDLVADGLVDESVDTTGLERLEVSTVDGDTDGDGDIDVLHTFSSRSFSIFDAEGNLVFDSGSEFEEIIASIAPDRFNDDDGDGNEDRSNAKGPEPEAIIVGEVEGATYAFIGLERDSGIIIYDISDPAQASFVNYIPPRFVDTAEEGEVARHAPETIAFIPAEDSTSGVAQIAVAYEVSGTTVVYDLTPAVPTVAIYDIQGAGHVSAFEGQQVKTTGIVTVVDRDGFYLQDADGDGDDATSDALFVFTGSNPTVAAGDEIRVQGTVTEFIPGGAGSGNLSTTQISNADIEVLSVGNALPEATVLGSAGRTPPTEIVISPEELPVNLQTDPGTFNPETDGIDFYESLEGMRVTVDNPTAISATNRFGETWVAADDGTGVTSPTGGLNERGGLNINADADGLGDLNPERIQIQYDTDLLPDGFARFDMTTGDDLSNITGVVGYGFGNFEVLVTEAFEIETPSDNNASVTEIEADEDRLTVATYNILNVTAAEADGDADQIAQLASQIVNNLGAPDILALQEVQDDSGVADDGTLSAEQTLQAIVDAIAEAGGPVYEFTSAVVDEDGENGGVPGGNIRNAFLYNPDRVEAKEFVTLESDKLADLGVTNADAFEGTRDPLLGVFEFNGQDVTLINNHFSSRFGSTPIFGGQQPFVQAGEDAREAQSLALNEVVDALLAEDSDAKISVLGDLNTFEFTDELTEDLPGTGKEQVLTNLIDLLEGDEAYTFSFQGNSQVLDHIFVTDGLLEGVQVDIVHVNTDFSDPASDHEPVVASFLIDQQSEEGEVLIGTRGWDLIDGTGGDDIILAGRGRDFVSAGKGDDVVFGERGQDTLNGDEGDDFISGGRGRDVIDGGEGNDWLLGGRGADVFIFAGRFGNDVIEDFNARQDIYSFVGNSPGDLAFEETDDGILITASGDAVGTVLLADVFDFNADLFLS